MVLALLMAHYQASDKCPVVSIALYQARLTREYYYTKFPIYMYKLGQHAYNWGH